MDIKDLSNLLYDANVEIDTEDFEVLWQGNSNKGIPNYLYHYEIIDITTNAGFILIRINKE